MECCSCSVIQESASAMGSKNGLKLPFKHYFIHANNAGPHSPLSCPRGCSLLLDLVKQMFTFLFVVTLGLWLSFSNVRNLTSSYSSLDTATLNHLFSEARSVCATSPLLSGSLTYIGSNNFLPCLYSLTANVHSMRASPSWKNTGG